MSSKTDWNGSITEYTHNERGQETSRTEAKDKPEERKITTEWHDELNLPVRIVEPEREVIMTYQNGRLATRQVKASSN